MCVLAEGTVITLRDLPAELLPKGEQLSFPATPAPIEACELTFMEAKRRYVNLFEAAYVHGVLERYAGNVSRAAEAADVDPQNFLPSSAEASCAAPRIPSTGPVRCERHGSLCRHLNPSG